MNNEATGVKTLRALTIKQINNAAVGDLQSFMVDNVEVSNVVACGHVVSAKTTSSGVLFSLDDTTETIECAFWANGSYDQTAATRITEGALVRVHGSLKTFNSKRSLVVDAISVVTTSHLVYHLTQCLYQSLALTHALPAAPSRSSASGRPSISRPSGAVADLPAIQSDILSVYRSNQDETGLELSTVIAMLRGRYAEKDIREAVDSLLNNCYLYYVDGESYKTVN